MSSFPGLAHIAITVSDLSASTAWYSALFGAAPVLDEDEASGTFHHTVFALDDGTLFGLHTHTGGGTPTTFDERQVGLDHIAFRCSSDELPGWRDRLDTLGIAHGGIKSAHYGSGLSFRDPDNIALEFFAPPA
ncbi:VOC family protein [Rhodococcus maanshanensis]|uniref:Catechol 2,3-dioxygenase n=1 Tax=Rhodococcus maanshanensis TaxID=183556 RepID=A0A1H7QAV2_9NOCA|nr:VOC family protein [Rhodococcus maanshanensis]SEL44417.1 Catechol 2,3-dioxygenase [Rhodococcus maanshanensis]